MISHPELRTPTKVRIACPVLLEQLIHATLEHIGNQKVAAKISIAQHNVDRHKGFLQASKQTMLTRPLAFERPYGGIEQRAIGQGHHSEDAYQRKSHARLLCAVLGLSLIH